MFRKVGKQFLIAPVAGVIIVMTYLLIVGGALKDPTPKNLPLALVGPSAATQKISETLQAKMPGAFRISTYNSVTAAKDDMRHNKLDGIIQLQPGTVQVVTASSTGEVTTAVVTQVAQTVAAAQHLSVQSTDLTPEAKGLGTAIVTMFLFLLTTVAAILTQAIINDRKAKPSLGTWTIATVLAAVCIGVSGAASAAILGEYGSVFWQVSGILTLVALVSACLSAMFTELLGQLGLSLSALLLIPFGVATAGVLFDYRFLPDFYAAIAPYFPVSNAVILIHQVAYFDSVGVGRPLLVLGVWLAATVGIFLAARLYRRYAASPAPKTKAAM